MTSSLPQGLPVRFGRGLASLTLIAVVGSSTGVATAAPAASRMSKAQGPAMVLFGVEDTSAAKTVGYSVDSKGVRHVHELRSQVVFEDGFNWESLEDNVRLFLGSLGENAPVMDPYAHPIHDQRRFVLDVGSVGEAMAIVDKANKSGMFERAFVGQRDLNPTIGQTVKGQPLAPVTGGTRGVTFNDPLFSTQWYISNGTNPGQDNNLLSAYVAGYTGDGVTIGLIPTNRRGFESDYYDEVQGQDWQVADGGHPDLAANINLGLSLVPNTQLAPSTVLTGMAGLMSAVGNNSLDITGIAPNSKIVSLTGGTAERQRTSIARANNKIGVQVFQSGGGGFPDMSYFEWTNNDYSDADADFVLDAQYNAINLGRSRRGIVQIFGTGADNSFFPSWDRYSLGLAVSLPAVGFLDIDLTALPDIVFVPPDDLNPDLAQSPFVSPGPRINYQQLVADPKSIVVSPFSQNQDFVYQTVMGTEVLTSVYAEVDDAEPQGMPTLTYSAGGPDTDDLIDSNSAQAVLGGIVALMLEANPSLTIRDIQTILVENSFPADGMDYNPSDTYGVTSDWQVNAATPSKPHSDRFGFGLLDGGAAVAAAADWRDLGTEYILDTGVIPLEEGEVPDAEFEEIDETTAVLIPGDPIGVGNICVRQNFIIEQIDVILNLTGEDHSDLVVTLTSPSGTTSLLQMPNELSLGSTTGQPFFDQRMVTFKHWGEESGGNWRIGFQDFGPDTDTPVGDDTADVVTFLGQYGIPGRSINRSGKTIVNYRLRIHAHEAGLEPFQGCPTGSGACPGDLNADGQMTWADFSLFLSWYSTGDLQADFNNNGEIDFNDIYAFLAVWRPGFCGVSTLPGARPTPGTVSDTGPVIRPI